MANKKITELDAITTLASTDVVPVVDVSADTTNKITTTNLFRTLPDGTAAAPSLSFASDAANGIYLASSDTVGISTGGTQRVTVDGSGNVTISGDLTVSGATTTVESTTVTIDDKNIELGSVASPSNTTADGGGITLKGATDKTIKWINSTGFWTFNTGVEIDGNLQMDDGKKIRLGTGQDLQIYHDATDSYIDNTQGDLYLRTTGSGDDIVIKAADDVIIQSQSSEAAVICRGDGQVELYHDATKKLETKSDGIDVVGEVQCDSLDVDGAVDIDGGQIYYDAANNNLHFIDNVKARFGTGSDLRIYHDGSNSFIDEAGTGQLFIRAHDRTNIQKYTGETCAQFIADGAVNLYHDGTIKFSTKSDGIDVAGEVQCDSLDVDGAVDITGAVTLHANLDLQDSDSIFLGTGDDLRLFHNGVNSHIQNDTGSLNIDQNVDDGDLALRSDNGSGSLTNYIICDGSDGKVRLYHYGTQKFETKSDGVDVTGEVQCDSLDVDGNIDLDGGKITFDSGGNVLKWADNVAAYFGTGSDLRIFHNGSESVIHDSGTGQLKIRTNLLRINNAADTETIATFDDDAAVSLYYDNSKKFETKSDGIDVTGEVQCDSLDVDGSADFTGDVAFRGGANAVEISANSDIRFINGIWTGDYGAKIQHHSNFLYIQGGSNGIIFRDPDGTDRVKLDSNGHLHPNGSNNYDLGTSSNQWRNAFFDGTVNADGLDVDGNADISGSLQIGSTSSANSSAIVRSSTSGDGGYYFNDGSNAGAIIYNHASNYMKFRVNGSDAGQFDSSGRLMLGTTTEGDSTADNLTIADSGNCGITVRSGTSSSGSIFFSDATSGSGEYDGYVQYQHDNRALRFATAATERLRINSNGAWGIEGASNYGTSGQVLTSNGNDSPTWQDAGAGSVGGANAISMNDNVKINFGASNDLQIYHDGTNSYIDDAGTGNLRLNGNEVHILSNDNSEYSGRFISNGAVELYHNGNKKFETKSDGVDITGELQCDTLDVDGAMDVTGTATFHNNIHLQDSDHIYIGTGFDIDIYHDGSHSYVKDNGTGNLKLVSNGTAVQIEKSDGENMAVFRTDGAVELYYDNSKKFETRGAGVQINGDLGIGGVSPGNSFDNGAALALGDNDTGIRQNGDGILEVWSNNAQMFRFRNGGNSNQSYNHLNPSGNNSLDLGTSSLRWRNVYTNDLNLSNEGSANDVDGTWGNYTIQEGEDDLFLINRRNGKKYKFNLTEVS